MRFLNQGFLRAANIVSFLLVIGLQLECFDWGGSKVSFFGSQTLQVRLNIQVWLHV